MKLIAALILSQLLLLPVLLHASALLHIDSIPYFYTGIAVILIAFILVLAGMHFFVKTADNTIAAISLICGASLNLSIFITVPVQIDRSMSIYFLSKVYAAGSKGVSEEEANSIITDQYINATKGVKRRLHEQVVTGTIRNTGENKYVGTPLLTVFIKICSITGELYSVGHNYCAIYSAPKNNAMATPLHE